MVIYLPEFSGTGLLFFLFLFFNLEHTQEVVLYFLYFCFFSADFLSFLCGQNHSVRPGWIILSPATLDTVAAFPPPGQQVAL